MKIPTKQEIVNIAKIVFLVVLILSVAYLFYSIGFSLSQNQACRTEIITNNESISLIGKFYIIREHHEIKATGLDCKCTPEPTIEIQ